MPQSHDKSLGPLTTRFTPPPSCFVEKIETGVGPISGMFSVSYGVSCGPDGDSFDTNCFPPITLTDKAGYPRDQHDDRQFSPGFYCPMGWNTGCSWERTSELLKSGLQEWDMSKLTNMKVGETHVACCPREYTCDILSGATCRRYLSSGDVVSGTIVNAGCDETITTTMTIDLFEDSIGLYGQMEPIHIVRTGGETIPSTDTTASITGKTTAITDATTTSGTDTTAATTVISSSENDGKSSGGALSTGAKAGIGVAVSLVALLAGAVVVFFLLRRRKARCVTPAAELGEKEAGGPVSAINNSHELHGDSTGAKSGGALSKRSETRPSSQVVYELPATDIERE